ncbi:MAG: hypothetical protein CMQ26_06720 [Gammaproteobacteria bacterium]|nr:hypothetical protein [Gammaproteobacteria bacterium]|tara:strand:- start:152 stop:367 length:216 start_codon:yes stop_codon:yes gene_type:complete
MSQVQIEELQIKYSFQEDTLKQLNEVVADQQKELLILKSEIRNLKSELQNMQETWQPSENMSNEQELPPHY